MRPGEEIQLRGSGLGPAAERPSVRRQPIIKLNFAKVQPLAFVALPVWVADLVTKRLAVAALQPANTPHPVLGDTVRLTLTYNQQGVMGLPVGPHGRWILSGVSIVLLGVLLQLLRTARAHSPLRGTALALIIGGACGNLVDRLLSSRGVVDFIDLGYGTWRFWAFNVADVAIDAGVALFAWTLWRAERCELAGE